MLATHAAVCSPRRFRLRLRLCADFGRRNVNVGMRTPRIVSYEIPRAAIYLRMKKFEIPRRELRNEKLREHAGVHCAYAVCVIRYHSWNSTFQVILTM